MIKSMEAIFRTHGLPEALRGDNGPPFASKEFEGLGGRCSVSYVHSDCFYYYYGICSKSMWSQEVKRLKHVVRKRVV